MGFEDFIAEYLSDSTNRARPRPWIRRSIVFHTKRHPPDLGEREVTAFVSSLAARA